ncbi:rRNA pseudouridine synthase [bacterium C-53]|nr:rRNA pseudouridine synthase [Lachnospiraceae bacterium]NBI01860.1 rRNA pseudouridine synthase [Lachnospiraceae bacterium]RKJ12419.1 rRNA pseudouridine synthase [bacterium C-53]
MDVMAQIRLDKFLSECGVGTRSEVKNFIRKGLVTVDGFPVKKPEEKVDTDTSDVMFQNTRITYEKYVYFLLHKPSGVVSASSDRNCITVTDLLKKEGRTDLFPVGRLDKDTEGLLLLTNDGELCHNLLSPKKHVKKTYFAQVEGIVTQQMIREFREGIDIGDEKKTLPAQLKILSAGEISQIELTICEGRFHQVKRMFESCGMRVSYLKRIAMGGLTLPDSLEKGSYRRLTPQEILLLKMDCERMEGNDVSGY